MDYEYTKHMAELQATHWWYEGRRSILRGIFSALKLPKGIKILEAGCGPGANLKMLSQFGEVSALEPEEFSIKYASEISGVKVLKGFLPEDIPFSDDFDVVCAFDVLEHVDDDGAALRALFDKTKFGGYGVFTVPAYDFLWSKHDEINHHFRRYNKQSFEKLLISAGYEVRLISYYNFWLFPVAAIVRFAQKIFKKKDEGHDIKMPKSTLVNKLLCTIFSSEQYLLRCGSLPFGLSLIAVCQKPKV